MAEATNTQTQPLDAKIEPKDFSQSEIVSIVCGKKRKKFNVHKDLLIKNSEYFRAMFITQSNWNEDTTNEVVWAEDCSELSVKSIEIWINWLYGRALDKDHKDTSVLLHCYRLGHIRGMYNFKNDMVDATRRMYKTQKWYCTPKNILECYLLDLHRTHMYDLLMQSWTQKVMTIDLTTERQKAAREHIDGMYAVAELAQDSIRSILKFKASPWASPHHLEGCHFHDHSDGSTCSATAT